ncbi:MAG TPA: holo-ACP synthase [Gemmatimonadales bacterium]|nr:holo-ACP synthase [Gemmatimonadales bacterium]
MIVIGVGIDLVEVARVGRMLRRKGDQALRRLLTDAERQYVTSRPDPVPHVAARLAAKEAVYKALQALPNARGIGWREIEVVHGEEGRPEVLLTGSAAKLAAAHGGIRLLISLTHTESAAGAVVVAQQLG